MAEEPPVVAIESRGFVLEDYQKSMGLSLSISLWDCKATYRMYVSGGAVQEMLEDMCWRMEILLTSLP